MPGRLIIPTHTIGWPSSSERRELQQYALWAKQLTHGAKPAGNSKRNRKSRYNDEPSERARTYNEIEQKLANETAWIPLYQSSYNYLQSPKIHGMVDNPLGIIDPEDWHGIYISI